MWQIAPPNPAELAHAARLLFSQYPEAERESRTAALLMALHGEDASGYRLFVAKKRDGNKIHGVGCLQLIPGRTAAISPPRCHTVMTHELAPFLLQKLEAEAQSHTVSLLQCLLPRDTGPDAKVLMQCGFKRQTTLLFLAYDLRESHEPVRTDFELQDCPVSADNTRLEQIIAATYEETADCPDLNGVRSLTDVVSGYVAACAPHEDYAIWKYILQGKRDVGCLLLGIHESLAEIIYFGLEKSVRRQGWGVQVLHAATKLARAAGAERLVAAVDVDNRPAINAYSAAGFTAWEQRVAFIKVL